MKSVLKVLMGLILVLATGAVRAAGNFEGEVDMKITRGGSDQPMTMQYFVKGHKMRTEIQGKEGMTGGGIFDWQTHEMIILMDKQKMYMVSELDPAKMAYGKDHHFKITKTGETQDILGYTCREYDYESDNGNGKVWLASGIGSWWGTEMAAQANKLPPDQRAMVSMVVAQKLFPMKTETMDKSGNAKSEMEVTKVDKKSLSSSLFEVPDGYRKLDMGAMMGQTSGGSNPSGGGDPLSGVKPKLPF
jgi:outer membrane lipoprotein-sorting protein